MSRSIRIIIPVFPTNETCFFSGCVSVVNPHDILIFITDFGINLENVDRSLTSENTIVGCYNNKSNHLLGTNILLLEKYEKLKINKLIISGENIHETESCIIMWYDYDKFKNSEVMTETDDCFSKLQVLIKEPAQSNGYEPLLESSYWLSSSMFLQHLLNYINLICWLIYVMRKEKKISIKPGNLLLAILTDIMLGYFLMELLTQDKKKLSTMLLGILETLVNLLFSLLKWLMGAPAGLKLNNAFNKMLGKYFSYHIQLWWLFLDVTGEKLDTILQIYHYMGNFGFTFQAAIISDMICIATFHSYCIYVYAARLFNIQIAGLTALSRLFVGRKYNPLRGGIDSCEYTNQELFVGTVAFTILLLLLPTTTMYYIVFALFRLLSLGVQYILAKMIHFVQTLPIYVVTLWLARSPRVAGNILLEVQDNGASYPLELKVKLFNKPLQELVSMFTPPVEPPKQFDWANLPSNIFVGKQIV